VGTPWGCCAQLSETGAGRTEAFDARGSMGDGRTAGKRGEYAWNAVLGVGVFWGQSTTGAGWARMGMTGAGGTEAFDARKLRGDVPTAGTRIGDGGDGGDVR
jgi:hypothetical protein